MRKKVLKSILNRISIGGFKLHYLYFIMAAIDFLVIGASLYTNHRNIDVFQSMLKRQYYSIDFITKVEQVSIIAGKANLPGNNIFESGNPSVENNNLEEALREYEYWLKKVSLVEMSKEEIDQIVDLDGEFRKMVGTSKRVIELYEAKKFKQAGAQMSQMDRSFAQVNAKTSQLRSMLVQENVDFLVGYNNKIKEASRAELILMAFFGVLILTAGTFGFYFSKKNVQNEKMILENSKMVMLGEMAGNIAHEINTPLAILRTRSSQLKRLVANGKFDETIALKIIDDLENTAIRMSKITDGLRSLSRSGISSEIEIVKLSKIISDVKAICQNKLEKSAIKFEIQDFDDINLACNPVQIEQVLVNLVNNSNDAVGELSNPWISLGFKITSEFIEIAVTDSGLGIDQNIADKIGKTFFTTKPLGKGTGIGLSISKRIAESHGGELQLNRKCKNTQFVLKLPIRDRNSEKLKVGA